MSEPMRRCVYLINPSADYPSYFGAEVFAHAAPKARTALVGDLALSTVAAMIPADFGLEVVDENISDVDFEHPFDIVAITGKISQWARMRAIATEFRRRGKLVIIGGPFASLSPETVRPHCDILVRGEGEETVEKVFVDIREGRWRQEYIGSRADLSTSPLPNWRIYPNHRAISACVQTSRGCPFECEFCDVIPYLGRKQRHKPISHVLRELDEVYRYGYRAVFLCDDNFTVYRSRAKELLIALRDWNRRQSDGKVEFATQVSIDAAKDDELLQLCAEAGLVRCFIGIETANEESLREAKKRQNLKVNLVDQVHKFFDHGISVIGGLIVGFDHDTTSVFEQQYQFAMASDIPILTVGALVAPQATPLYERMRKEKRLVTEEVEAEAVPWDTNIIPKGMTREELHEGMKRLCNRLYHPDAFGERVVRFIERTGPRRDPAKMEERSTGRDVEFDALNLIAEIPKMGEAEARMWSKIAKALRRKKELTRLVFAALMQYRQIRFMYEQGRVWEPRLAV
jgi:radical SAM superfamily enzyme YgiQ (UPF0313 family)